LKNTALNVLLRRDVQRRALIISLIAGTLLNCINQIPELMAGEPINIVKFLLTYLVPYSVSAYSSVKTITDAQRKAEAT